jgi:hypothetical protein
MQGSPLPSLTRLEPGILKEHEYCSGGRKLSDVYADINVVKALLAMEDRPVVD